MRPRTSLKSFGPTILYAETDSDLCDVMIEYLGANGFDATAVRTAEAALDQLKEPGRFKMLMTNYSLTSQGGERCFREVAARGLLPPTSIIVLSASPVPEGLEGYRFLRKPVDTARMLHEINAAIGSGGGEQVDAESARPQGADSSERVELRLYLSPGSRDSKAAVGNLNRILKLFGEGSVHLDVHELSGANLRSLELAEEDRIMVTPTLVRVQPSPKLWVLGDLSKRDLVIRMIESGLSPESEAE